ncbi:hypothetical protein N7540_007025 [Penicillium herquei]|nr:hypothetical protein N7540_007025 [Penicillium herquei]
MHHFQQQRPLNRDGFEIAIICALPREANAVLCVMDEVWHDSHQYYGKIAGDDNSYEFGRIGLYYVVIVTLPKVESVESSSASQSLKISFGSIKLALIVGICGAVPFQEDESEIVLGDVIIAESIVDLDVGRQYSHGFKRMDELCRPSTEILGLLQRWKIPFILDTLRHGSTRHLECLLQRLSIDYPGADHDILFHPDYIHKHHGTCTECLETDGIACQSALAASCSNTLCDKSQEVARRRLEKATRSDTKSHDLAIHIGSIGTWRRFMKSTAWQRDQHAQSEGIIGFEMEGVGVWNKFNCIVIKGVCDYADSHKHEAWQGYAAAAAAAVAKEVLNQYVMPQKVPQPAIPSMAITIEHGVLSHSILDGSQTVHDGQSSTLGYPGNWNSEGHSEKKQLRKDAERRFLASLRFPQMQERAQQIEPAYEKTYAWILQARERQGHAGWDDPVPWLSSSSGKRRIYWISGKAGAGKSTLMRFLTDKLDEKEHMLPWAQGCSVVRASYFSWSSGKKLQKSLEGLLRSLLFQILEKKPNIITEVIDEKRWSSAQISSINLANWTNPELLSSLQACVLGLQKIHTRVLLFVDGLDEFECTDQMREELIQILEALADAGNVKIFVSSRPWNIFQDSFHDFPKIRLENLTRGDINSYVRAKFLKNPRFQYLLHCDQRAAEDLICGITNKAQGFFLWVRLVVRDVLKGIRDGDSLRTLYGKLEEIPADLEEYFKRLISSIDPQHVREASIILQIALHEETDFAPVHPLRLIDLSFIDESSPDFLLTDPFNHSKISINDREGLKFRLDSTLRRLNSRCMGLLECTYSTDGFVDLFDEGNKEELEYAFHHQGLKFEPSTYPDIFDGPNLFRIFMLNVGFLHRCCRDFLLSPQIQSLLYRYTEGQYDARAFIVNARISQFVALQTAGGSRVLSTGLASYLASALSAPQWRETSLAIRAAHTLQPAIEAFAKYNKNHSTDWEISLVLKKLARGEKQFSHCGD